LSPASTASRTKRPRARKTAGIAFGTCQHPEDPDVTWSGRGRKPAWIVEWIERGKPIEDLRTAQPISWSMIRSTDYRFALRLEGVGKQPELDLSAILVGENGHRIRSVGLVDNDDPFLL